MRKSLILTVLLLVFAAGSLGYAHSAVDQSKAAVVIDETVLHGDKAAAEGIMVDLSIHCDYRLFWNTRYTIGEPLQISTEFTFSPTQNRPEVTRTSFYFWLDNFFGGGYGISGTVNVAAEVKPIQDVASRTQPGEEHTEIVHLRDYYEFYPLRGELERRKESGNTKASRVYRYDTEDALRLINDYFKIPVDPRHKLEISIEKDAAGTVRHVRVLPVRDSRARIVTESAMTDKHCFFTISPYGVDGELLDTSHIPGGYGIYRMPLPREGAGGPTLDADELQTVFPLDAERARVVGLQTSADESKLLLVTIEEGSYMLTVIDAQSMEQLQQLEMLNVGKNISPDNTEFRRLCVYDEFIVAIRSDGRFALLALDAQGNYEVRLTGDLSEQEELGYVFSYELQMDYDGEKLVMAAFQDGWYQPRNYCSFYLAVYDDGGLAYAGHYQHNLDKSWMNNHTLNCRPAVPLAVTWGD